MNKIYGRVAFWNSQRYNREFNHELSFNLLKEEFEEWCHADTEVDELDALCDVVFVSFGIVWKLGLTTAELEGKGEAAANYVNSMLDNFDYIDAMVKELKCFAACITKQEYVEVVYRIVLVSMTQALGMGLTEVQVKQALHIVCDSNESKSIRMNASNVKANTNKGTLFIAPERRLAKLLSKRGR